MMNFILLLVNALLMISLPFVLGWYIKRRRGMGWGLFAIGGATFVMSQVAHIPFNLAVLPAVNRLAAALPDGAQLYLIAVFLGLSAGLFEEGARYLVYRYWATDARTWGGGLMLGAGHGGTEAIILGVLAAINASFFVAYELDYLSYPAEQQVQVQAALDTISGSPWYELLLGAVERISAMALHLSLSLMVMQCFLAGRRRLAWLTAAILWHALLDAAAVIAISLWGELEWGALAAEAIIGAFGLISLVIIFYLRTPEPVEPELVPLPAAGPAPPIDVPISKESIDDSRYL